MFNCPITYFQSNTYIGKLRNNIKQITFFFLITSYIIPFCNSLTINGHFRNDIIYIEDSGDMLFSNILENRLIFNKKGEKWKFYGDVRAYLYSGQIAEIVGDREVKLLRSFIRYYFNNAIFTLGKTYINLGNIGVFNPFELNKALDLNDLKYDKEGIFALALNLQFGKVSGLKFYLSPTEYFKDSAVGIDLFTNVKKFDTGIVANRISPSKNRWGIYFKGDLFVGLYGGFAHHFDDTYTNYFLEYNLGVNYIFSKFFLNLTFYYNGIGADSRSKYTFLSTDDYYFQALDYLYGSILFLYDEFLNFGFDSFVNLIDGSGIYLPQVIYTINNGLNLTILTYFVTGKDGDDFSISRYGKYGFNLRLEAKF